MDPVVRVVPHGSREYLEALDLRRRVLRWPLGLEYTEEQIAAESAETHFLAYLGERCVGSLTMAPRSEEVVKMRQVAVDGDFQSRGIGGSLVQASESWAQESGFERIELHARQSALPFYERLGYRTLGAPFEEVGIPHRKMVKEIR
ncbi:MAG TPA: GNAT family N-acetyltransferase [Fimbriimonadaceae bacterium]|nr:GNAT family N-acetyltransferase [Fimbriimonadaceae bacterium]